jgi:hypothetical protein
MSVVWSEWVSNRIAAYRENSERHVRVHGTQVVDDMQRFYDCVNGIFANKNLGGVVLVARCPGRCLSLEGDSN